MHVKYLIIGASAAGISAINTLRRLDPFGSIVCVTREKELPYNKCFLADYASGSKSEEQLIIFSEQQEKEKEIQFLKGVEIISLNPDQCSITTSDDQTITYQSLLIATGSSPFVPTIPGISNIIQGLFTFHTLSDVHNILSYVDQHKVKKVAIIGAGLSGVECADSLIKRGLQVTLIERENYILSSQISPDMATLIQNAMIQAGGIIYCGAHINQIKSNNGVSSAILLNNGEIIETEMVIMATGLRPNSQLAITAEMECQKGAIITDDRMLTSIPGVYAAGDVALVKDQVTGNRVISTLWPDAMLQGMIAAHSMGGISKSYPGVFQVTSSAFFGLKYAAYGMNRTQDDYIILKEDASFSDGFYRVIINNGQITGFTLLGVATKAMPLLKRIILTRQSVTDFQVHALFLQV